MAVSPEATEMVAMLGRVPEAEFLEEIAQDVGVENFEAARGDTRRLYRTIVSRINSEAFDDMEDGGLALILAARDKLRIHLGIAAPDPSDVLTAAMGFGTPKVETAAGENLDSSESEPEDSGDDFKVDTATVRSSLGTTRDIDPQPRKELKLSGSIGKAGEKGKLTLSNLKSQIRMAQARHYKDAEICAAVIRIMSPSLDLRSYFDEQRKLTVKDLLFHLEAHYHKQDAKILFNKLGGAVMADGQTAVEFAYQLMGERDRLANLPKRERGSYTKKLIQEQFQRALYTGMRNQVARRELKPLLCGDVVPTDGEIIEEISSTCMVDLEHKSKLAGLTGSRRHNAVTSQSDSDSSDSNTSARKRKSKKKENPSSSQDRSDGWVAELTSMLVPILDPITARVNSLTGDMEKLMSQQVPQKQVQVPQLMQIQPFGQQTQQLQHQQQLNPSAPLFDGGNGGQPVNNRFVPPLYNNPHLSNPHDGRGRGRGRGQSGGPGAGAGQVGQVAKFRCPKCVEDNAVFCNHCKTCWRIDHRTCHCPHKGDPTFVPSKNC